MALKLIRNPKLLVSIFCIGACLWGTNYSTKKKKITLLGEDEKKLCVIKARLIMSLKNTNTGTQGAHRRSLVVKSLTYMHRDPIWTLVPVLAAPLLIQLPGSWLRFSK